MAPDNTLILQALMSIFKVITLLFILIAIPCWVYFGIKAFWIEFEAIEAWFKRK